MIEIRQPEIEALIMERLHTGSFQTVEDVLYQALTEAPLPQKPAAPAITAADILAAFERSPFKEVNLEQKSTVSAISSPVEF